MVFPISRILAAVAVGALIAVAFLLLGPVLISTGAAPLIALGEGMVNLAWLAGIAAGLLQFFGGVRHG